MQKIVLLLCFAILHTVCALNCYSCWGPTCETEIKTWDKRTCGTATLPANLHAACLKMGYKDKTTQKKVVQRKCIITELMDGKPSYKCSNMFGDVTECSLCQTDLCNSAKSTSFSFAALCGVVLAIAAPELL